MDRMGIPEDKLKHFKNDTSICVFHRISDKLKEIELSDDDRHTHAFGSIVVPLRGYFLPPLKYSHHLEHMIYIVRLLMLIVVNLVGQVF